MGAPARPAPTRVASSAEASVDGAGRGALLALLGCWSLLPLLIYPLVTLPEDNQYKLVRLAALPLAVLAADGLVRALGTGGARRAAARLVAAVGAIGLAALTTLGLRSYLDFARVELPIEELPHALLPVADGAGEGADSADRVAAYRALRSASDALARDPVLVLNPFGPSPEYGGSGGRERHGFRTEANLQGHEAAAFAGVSLWCDRHSYLVERAPAWASRLVAQCMLFGTDERVLQADLGRAGLAVAPGQVRRDGWAVALWHEVESLERPVFVLVCAADHAASPTLQVDLTTAGFTRARAFGAVELWSLRSEDAAALAAPGGAR